MSVCLLFSCILHDFWNLSWTFLYSLSGCTKIKKFTYIILLKGVAYCYFSSLSASYCFFLCFLFFGNYSFFFNQIWYIYFSFSIGWKTKRETCHLRVLWGPTWVYFSLLFSWEYLTVQHFFTVMVTSLQKVFTVCLSFLGANLGVFRRNFKVYCPIFWHRFNVFSWNIAQMFLYYFGNNNIDINMACWFLVGVIFGEFLSLF